VEFLDGGEGGGCLDGGGRFLRPLGLAEGGGGFFGVLDEGSPALSQMAEGFEEADADGGGEIETAGGREHGNAEAVVGILME